VRVRVGLKLVRLPQKEIVAMRTVFADAPAQQNSVPAVVGALNTALHQVIGEAVAWTLASMARK
jgi:ABC-type uncharacterized transport system auxiliary subunit